jgi:Domain of unknown function (DUF6429)
LWKSFDWDAMERLHGKGYVTSPMSKAKSVGRVEKVGEAFPETLHPIGRQHDLRNVTQLALERGDGRGEAFSFRRAFGEPARFQLSTERCRWTLESTDVVSIAGALDALLREPSTANLANVVGSCMGGSEIWLRKSTGAHS